VSVRSKRTAALGPARVSGGTLYVAQLSDAPLALYPMDEPSGTTMNDASGNGRNGSYTSVTLGQTPIGTGSGVARCTQFDGSASIATVTYGSWMNSNSFTVEVLVQYTSVTSYRGLAARDNGSTNRDWQFRTNAGQADFVAWNDGGTLYSGAGAGTTNGTSTPYLMAMRWDAANSRLKMFRNGSEWASLNVTSYARATSIGLCIGAADNGGNYKFAGYMSNFAWYGSALTDARLLNHAIMAGLA
jgi:hypothetical protein